MKKRSNWVHYVIAGTFAALGLGGFALYTVLGPPPAAAVYGREEFRVLLVGKTEGEVLEAVGTPETTQNFASGGNWYYARLTRDPVTGKTDRRVQVVFKDGRVESVNFH